jgi:hypothetical protein
MKKMFLISALVFGLVLTGQASDGFQIKPKLFWSSISPLIIHPFNLSNYRFGFTIVGFDYSLLKYKNFYFLAVGGGLQAYQKTVIGWHMYYDYYGYPQYYYGKGYTLGLEPYLKFVPVKYRWKWASKAFNLDTYLELGITNKKDIVVGVTFSGNPFKKKVKKEIEED